jgi:hypothetical protein
MRTRTLALLQTALMAAVALGLSAGVTIAASTPLQACPPPVIGQAITFTMPLPDSIRSAGTHQYEFHDTWTPTDPTDPGMDDATNAVTFDSGAPLYPGDVFVRPFYLMVPMADGSVAFGDTTLNPSQPARFAVTWFLNQHDTVFASSIQSSIRWETSPGVWSAWTVLPKGPAKNPCAPGGSAHWGGFFKEAWGWGG